MKCRERMRVGERGRARTRPSCIVPRGRGGFGLAVPRPAAKCTPHRCCSSGIPSAAPRRQNANASSSSWPARVPPHRWLLGGWVLGANACARACSGDVEHFAAHARESPAKVRAAPTRKCGLTRTSVNEKRGVWATNDRSCAAGKIGGGADGGPPHVSRR